MAWLVGLIVVLLVIFAAVAYPRFGTGLLVFIGLCVGLAAVSDYRSNKEREESKTRIQPGEIEFDKLQLVPAYSTDSYYIRGRVRNRSASYTLTGVDLKITMDDCPLEPVSDRIARLDSIEQSSAGLSLPAQADIRRRVNEERARLRENSCDRVGETTAYVYVTIPPGQVRSIDDYVSFSDLGSPRGKHVWGYALTESRAK